MSDEQQYFLWDDDVAIPFRLTGNYERVVPGAGLLEMARSLIWRSQVGRPDLTLTPQQAIRDITDLFNRYRPGLDEAVLHQGLSDLPLCTKDGRDIEEGPLCKCGHLFTEHQSGDGPWTGFCGGQRDEHNACDCERPEEVK